MGHCENCGARLHENTHYCGRCGTLIRTAEPEGGSFASWACPRCGGRVERRFNRLSIVATVLLLLVGLIVIATTPAKALGVLIFLGGIAFAITLRRRRTCIDCGATRALEHRRAPPAPPAPREVPVRT